MGRKPKDKKAEARFEFRCPPEELEAFRRAAEREGFGGNVSAWLLWHLRRIIRESEAK